MSYLGVSADEIRREAEEASLTKSQKKEKKRSGIFGLAKDGAEATQCLASSTKVAIDLEMLNKEIAEAGKGDFYTAYLRDNMFQKIRKEITDYQGK